MVYAFYAFFTHMTGRERVCGVSVCGVWCVLGIVSVWSAGVRILSPVMKGVKGKGKGRRRGHRDMGNDL